MLLDKIKELNIARENNKHILDMLDLLLQYSKEEIQKGNIDVPDMLKYMKNYAGCNRQILDELIERSRKK